jgi:hypothetical protein
MMAYDTRWISQPCQTTTEPLQCQVFQLTTAALQGR